MDASNTSPEDKIGRIAGKVFSFLVLIAGIALIIHWNDTKAVSMMSLVIITVVLLVTAFVIVPVAWWIANKVRLWIMPDTVFSSGAMDALGKKIFWSIGPQVATAFFAALIFFAVTLAILVGDLEDKPTEVVSSISESTPNPAPAKEPSPAPSLPSEVATPTSSVISASADIATTTLSASSVEAATVKPN